MGNQVACVCTPWNHRDSFQFVFLLSAEGAWSRDRAGANEDTYLLLAISTGGGRRRTCSEHIDSTGPPSFRLFLGSSGAVRR